MLESLIAVLWTILQIGLLAVAIAAVYTFLYGLVEGLHRRRRDH